MSLNWLLGTYNEKNITYEEIKCQIRDKNRCNISDTNMYNVPARCLNLVTKISPVITMHGRIVIYGSIFRTLFKTIKVYFYHTIYVMYSKNTDI